MNKLNNPKRRKEQHDTIRFWTILVLGICYLSMWNYITN